MSDSKIKKLDYKKYKEKILNSLKKKEEKYKYLQKFYKKELWIYYKVLIK